MDRNSKYNSVAQLVEDQRGLACLLLREDFDACGEPRDVEAALATLVADGTLARLRDDAYAYTQRSAMSGKLVLACSLQALAEEYAVRVGASIRETRAQRLYATGASKQVPNSRFVGVDQPIAGSLRFRERSVAYECV